MSRSRHLGIVRDQARPKKCRGLIGALQDPEADVREAAALALSSYGLDAPSRPFPALTKASKDPDEDVQREAARALVHINELKGKPPA